MTTLWDTTGSDVVRALEAERRSAGALAFGLALTLVVVTDQDSVAEAEAAAKAAAAAHPCRILLVIRRHLEAPDPRLDAEVLIGGRLGPGEAVVMRMYGRLGAARRVGRAAAAGAGRAGRHVVARRDAGQDRVRPAGRVRRPAGHREHVQQRPDGRAASAGGRLRARRHRPVLGPHHELARARRRRVRLAVTARRSRPWSPAPKPRRPPCSSAGCAAGSASTFS